MSAVRLYLVSGAVVFSLGLYGLLARPHLLRKILAANLMGTGVFLVLLSVARRTPEVDVVPHAMVLTGIVVSVSMTAFSLVLTRRIRERTGRVYLPEESPR